MRIQRLFVLGLALLALVTPRAILAAATDPMEGDYAAGLSSAAPEATTYETGDWGVADETGAATYSIPIPVAPGRHGMAPGLELSYSSRGALRGGLAAGWSLELPSIRRDTSGGTLDPQERYVASFGGRTARLIEVPDTPLHAGRTFRMELDDGFVRFELAGEPVRGDVSVVTHTVEKPSVNGYRVNWCQYYSTCGQPAADRFCEARFGAGAASTTFSKANNVGAQTPTIALGGPDLEREMRNTCQSGHCDAFHRITCELPTFGWVAHTPDGETHYLGTTEQSTDGFSVWHLDRKVDAAGNAIDYSWREVEGSDGRVVDRALDHVEYSSNDDAGVGPHAEVAFEYAPSPDLCDDGVESVVKTTYESSTDRGGQDYTHFNLSAADPGLCQNACLGDSRCASWTYVKPGVQGSSAVCWLKNSVPAAEGNSCCTSGVKYAEPAPVQDEVPVGALVSYQSGEARHAGALRLDAVVSRVHDAPGGGARDVHRVELGYDQDALSCDAIHAPLRRLERIEHIAYAADATETALPPITFEYADWDPEPSSSTTLNMPPVQQGTDHSLESTLMQIDGDGIADRVSVRVDPDVFRGGRCELIWQAGLPGGGYADSSQSLELPTLPWGLYETPTGIESCSLIGQVTLITNKAEDPCEAGSYQATGTILNYRFADVDGDGDDDLATAVHADPGLYTSNTYQTLALTVAAPGSTESWFDSSGYLDEPSRLYQDPSGSDDPEPYTDDGPGPDFCDLVPFTPSCLEDRHSGIPDLYTCEGMPRQAEREGSRYVWRVWENTGGSFDEMPDSPALAPFALAPVGNEGSRIGRLSYASSNQAIIDIDGDGRVDLVHAPDLSQPVWRVYPSNGRGAWGRDGGYVPWTLPMRLGSVSPSLSQSDPFSTANRNSWGTMGLGDVNGDGLPDLLTEGHEWCQVAGRLERCGVELYANNGHGFESLPRRLGASIPATLFQNQASGIIRHYDHYRTDVDGDGLEDIISLHSSPPVYYPNAGGHFLSPPRALPSIYSLAQRQVRVVSGEIDPTTQATYQWEMWNDFTDMTGDGLKDLVGWSGDWASILSPRPDGAQPHRLIEIDTGTGARIQFHYASVNDPAVVTRTPERDTQRDLPHKLWVVDATTVLDDSPGGSPESSTQYRYEDPIFDSETAAADARARFLGFTRVMRTTPLGAEIEQTFAYDGESDARARLLRKVISADGSPVSVHVVEPRAEHPLFDGLVTFSHKAAERTHTCVPGDTVETCSEQEQDLLERNFDWQPYEHDGQTVLFLATGGGEAGTTGGVTEERHTISEYVVRYADGYRVLATATEVMAVQQPGGVGQRVSRVETDYDDRGLPVAKHQWIEGGIYATTERSYDEVGNVTSERRPEQVASGGPASFTEYGANRVFLTRSANELGHVVDFAYDAGTGAMLERAGPNVDELERFEVDGFGRPLARWVSVAKGKSAADVMLMTLTEYVDVPAPGGARSVHVEERIDTAGAQWRIQDSLLDARDRVVEILGVEARTTYAYDAEGNVVTIGMQDPSAESTQQQVEYHYTRDALGRPTRFTRPDGSGATLIYEGLRTVVQEDGATERIEQRDVLGRLIEVEEIGGTSGPALTEYFHDAMDNVVEIVDADGNTTHLHHDGLGRRVEIERTGRAWRYDYDLNGNMIAETAPIPPGAAAAEYTTTIAFDDLDRPTHRFPATRGHSSARQLELGIGTIKYQYDTTQHKTVGRLSKVILPFGWVKYRYDTRGLVTWEQRRVDIDGAVPIRETRSISRVFNALGLPTQEVDAGNKLKFDYDMRGLVENVRWRHPSTRKWHSIAHLDRSRAGQVTARHTDFGQRRTYAYDVLGRPIGDEITGPAGMLAWREYDYTVGGDLAAVRGATGATSAAAGFVYDGLHRVVRAEGPGAYSARFDYSAAGNVVHADVSLPGSPIDRDAAYVYAGLDPQAVTKLSDGRGGVYDFDYDLSGNMIDRTTPEGRWQMDWDGEDQLREVVDADGHREVYYYDHEGQRVAAIGDESIRIWIFGAEYAYDAEGMPGDTLFHASAGGPTLARVKNGTDLELQYSDNVQNLMLSVDTAGQAQSAFLYGAYGEIVHEEGGEEQRRQFNGKEHDAISGLRYYGARFYDPVTLRWASADPKYRFAPDVAWNEPQRMNLYAFTLNNPLRYYDPDGMDAVAPLMTKREFVQLAIACGPGIAAVGPCATSIVTSGAKVLYRGYKRLRGDDRPVPIVLVASDDEYEPDRDERAYEEPRHVTIEEVWGCMGGCPQEVTDEKVDHKAEKKRGRKNRKPRKPKKAKKPEPTEKSRKTSGLSRCETQGGCSTHHPGGSSMPRLSQQPD